MERTYSGLHDSSEAKVAADQIESSDEYRLQFKMAKRARGFEDKCRERQNTELTLLRSSDVPPPNRQLAGSLHIRDLTRIAGNPGDEGLAAQRCLNSLYARCLSICRRGICLRAVSRRSPRPTSYRS